MINGKGNLKEMYPNLDKDQSLTVSDLAKVLTEVYRDLKKR